MLKHGVFDKIFTHYTKKLIKMLIIGKNIQNETTKIQIAYSARAGLDLMTGTCDCPRPELKRARGIE